MKKFACLLALCAAPAFGQLSLRVVDGSNSATHTATGNPESITVKVQGQLTAGTGGLALFGVNLTNTGPQVFDLCNEANFLLTAPVAIQPNFDRNGGLTNPPGLGDPFITGYSGTCDGAGGLWQIGGGQNTIGNTGPTAYPIGAVVSGVGNSGWTDLATGTIDLDGTETQNIVLTLNTGFANTLDLPVAGPPYNVTEAATVTIAGGLTISFGIPCAATDVNCDGSTNSSDILVIRQTVNWNKTTGTAGNPNSDVNGDGNINSSDILVIRQTVNWNTSTGPCICN